jgi:hypothetical protein
MLSGFARSVATATAHAKVPVVIAAAMTGHSPQVYDACYARAFRDAEERERVRNSLASIGFGNAVTKRGPGNEVNAPCRFPTTWPRTEAKPS